MSCPDTNKAAELAARLRSACQTLRRTSMPLADLIPLMQQAADALASQAEPVARVIRNEAGQVYIEWCDGKTPLDFVGATLCATPPAPAQAKDGRRLDHLQEMADNGVVSMCFEFGGGYHVTLEGVGDEPIAARHKNTIRDGIDWFIAQRDAAIAAKEQS